MKTFAAAFTLGISLAASSIADEDEPEPEPAIGSPAPVAEALNQDNESVDLAAAYEAGPVLLWFYPKAGTGG